MGSNLPPTIAQALAAFAPPQSEVHREVIAMERFNDDDLYEFDAFTFELFDQHSPQCQSLQWLVRGAPSGVAMLHNGHSLARGMKVKTLGLWRRRSPFDGVPKFLAEGATA